MTSVNDSPQHPTTRVGITDGPTFLDGAVELLARCGLDLDPWQETVLADWLRRTPDGSAWAHFQCGLTIPRQNGKNFCLEARELFGAAVLGERILHTAHEVKTARKHFSRLKYFFGEKAGDRGAASPELAALVRTVRNTNGQEAIVLSNGGSIEIAARSRGSARGYTVDTLVIDEAQELSDDALEALTPTIAAAPSGNPQQIWTGTVPGPNSLGEPWTRMRRTAQGSHASDASWDEWAAPAGSDDDAAVLRANPALDTGRLSQRVIAGERASLSPDGFARERLGRWPDPNAAVRSAISPDLWRSSAAEPPSDGVRAAALVGASDGHWALAAAMRAPDGRVHVNLICSAPAPSASLDPALAWLAGHHRRLSRVAVFGGAVAPTAIEALRTAGVPQAKVRRPGTAEYLDACGALYAGLGSGAVTHPVTDGADGLSRSALACAKKTRRQDGGFGWVVCRPGGDATPLEAMSMAAASAVSTRRTGRRQVVL